MEKLRVFAPRLYVVFYVPCSGVSFMGKYKMIEKTVTATAEDIGMKSLGVYASNKNDIKNVFGAFEFNKKKKNSFI